MSAEELQVQPPFDVYTSENMRIDMSSGKHDVTLVIKTWGPNFANKPTVLVLTPEVAKDLLRRLKKAVDGLI